MHISTPDQTHMWFNLQTLSQLLKKGRSSTSICYQAPVSNNNRTRGLDSIFSVWQGGGRAEAGHGLEAGINQSEAGADRGRDMAEEGGGESVFGSHLLQPGGSKGPCWKKRRPAVESVDAKAEWRYDTAKSSKVLRECSEAEGVETASLWLKKLCSGSNIIFTINCFWHCAHTQLPPFIPMTFGLTGRTSGSRPGCSTGPKGQGRSDSRGETQFI